MKNDKSTWTRKDTFWADRLNEARLGGYVYALKDPRDGKIFYVGLAGGKASQGNNRPDQHLLEALDPAIQSRKVELIREIWDRKENPELIIIRHGLLSVSETKHVEAACIDLLRYIYPEKMTNIASGYGVKDHSLVSSDKFKQFFAEPVSPKKPIQNVWLFNISKTIKERGPYDAVRASWKINSKYCTFPAYAVGLVDGISRIVVEITKWAPGISNSKKKSFEGNIIDETEIGRELCHKNFHVLVRSDKSQKTLGYFQRGGTLCVDFLGDGRAQFTRGVASNKERRL